MEKLPNNNEQLDSGAEKAEVPQETLEEFGEKATETAEATADDSKNEDAIIANAGADVAPLAAGEQSPKPEVPEYKDLPEFGTQSVGAEEVEGDSETLESEEAAKIKEMVKVAIPYCLVGEEARADGISKEKFVQRGIKTIHEGLLWLQDAVEDDSDSKRRQFVGEMLSEDKARLYGALLGLGSSSEDPARWAAKEDKNSLLDAIKTETEKTKRECHEMSGHSADEIVKRGDFLLGEQRLNAILKGVDILSDNIEEALSDDYDKQQEQPAKKIKVSISKFEDRFGLPHKNLQPFGTPEQ